MKSNEETIDQSLMSTPKPTATSTITKKPTANKQFPNRKPVPLHFDSSSSLQQSETSLEILKTREMELTKYSESEMDLRNSLRGNRLKNERLLAQNLIDRASKNVGLPSKYLKADSMLQESNGSYKQDFSTVNESDLLGRKESFNSQSFFPGNMSTPRSSEVEKSTETSIFDNITTISEQLRNSDISLQDVCSQLHRVSLGKSSTAQPSGLESQVFKAAELMTEEFRRDEMSWRREKGLPVITMKDSISFSEHEKPSMGGYFLTKKNDLGELFRAKSPERSHSPTPLVDITNQSVTIDGYKNTGESKTFNMEGDSSLLSVTRIQKILSELSTDSPMKMVDKLLNKGKPETNSSEPRNRSKSPISPVELKTPTNEQSAKDNSEKYLTVTRSRSLSPHSPVEVKSPTNENYIKDNSKQYLTVHPRRSSSPNPIKDNSEQYLSVSQRRSTSPNPIKDKSEEYLAVPPRRSSSPYPFKDIAERNSSVHRSHSQSSNPPHELKTPTNDRSLRENDCDEYMAQMRESQVRSRRSEVSEVNAPRKSQSNQNRRRSHSPYNSEFGISDPQARSSIISRESTRITDGGYSSSAMPSIKDNKENISDSGSSGLRCPSSLESLPDGKLPIKGNKIEIIWGCLKVGKSVTQSCSIRNQLNQRIRIQVSVTGSNFRIVKDKNDTEMLTSMIFILHPLEIKTLSVMFHPREVGASCEKLHFYPMSNGELVKHLKQTMKLYGYGGHTSIDMNRLAKDTNGKLWISLGVLDYNSVVKQYFTIANTGILSAFAFLELGNDVDPNNIKISPREMIIKPKEEVQVTITYTPTKEDYRSQLEILDIGSIKITAGAEVTRGRLRRLYYVLLKNRENIKPIIEKLSKKFPNEDIPYDLGKITETKSSLDELLSHLIKKEIRLTIEKDPNQTLERSGNYFEDSTFYQTLYQDSSTLHEETTYRSNSTFTIEPNKILFSLPYKKEDTILFQSKIPTPTPFKIEASRGFKVFPIKGVVSSDNMVVVRITCIEIPKNDKGKVFIYVKDNVIEVDLKTVLIKSG